MFIHVKPLWYLHGHILSVDLLLVLYSTRWS